jgi:hypothetical protein
MNDSKKKEMSREHIMLKYVEHPYMKRMLEGKIKTPLSSMVDLIDSGEADELEEEAIKREIKVREARY